MAVYCSAWQRVAVFYSVLLFAVARVAVLGSGVLLFAVVRVSVL